MSAEREFTEEQLRAIERRDGPLLVSAGAGAGKTSVLVERFVRSVLEDGAAVESILAITFTEKAAAQLRSRVRERFRECGRTTEARASETAWISTIHGFCARVLRTHSLTAGLDPEFRVIEALESERLRLEAFELALASYLGKGDDADRLDLVVRYGADGLADMVRTTYSHLRSLGHEHPRLPSLAEPREAEEVSELRTATAQALAELGSAQGKRVGDARTALESCVELLEEDGLPAPAALERLSFSASAANALKGPACARYLEARAGLLAACAAQAEFADSGHLRHLLAAYGERYGELKRERSGVDFDDLELGAARLFAQEPELCEDYAGRFTQIMVDEFQDVNRLQNKLLGQLERHNLFRVGDERQSIYRFRHADVRVFAEHRDAAAAEGRAERITVNFRSRGEVLEAIDSLFASIWGDGFVPLREGPAAREGEPRASPCVELLVSDRHPARWKEVAGQQEAAGEEDAAEAIFGPSMRGVAPWRAAEARLMARRIDQLTRGGPYEHRDVVVLVRATTSLSVYERALEERGIPTYVLGGRGYWSQQQVSDLRAYLAALANPRDELALLSLLGSPMVGVSLGGLVLVAELGRRARGLWDALERLVPAGGRAERGEEGAALAAVLPNGDLRLLERFVPRFRGERADAPRISLERLIDRAVTESGYDRAVLALPAGDRRMANVRKLMRMAREFESEEGRDLRRFIDFVAERDLVSEREGQAPLESEDVDAVRLMTVHRAKGLEFPVVCVADLGKRGREDDSALRISEDGSVGIRLASIEGGRMDSAQLARIKERQRREDEEEERRVFYVAATRAREHLILSGATDLEKLPGAADMEEPMRWVRAALLEAPGVRVEEVRPSELEATLPDADRRPAAPAVEPVGLDVLQAPVLSAVTVPAALPVSRLSYSGLESYRRCGYRFYLERTLRLPAVASRGLPPDSASAPSAAAASEPPPTAAEPEPLPPAAESTPALPPRLRGTLVHGLLEELDFAAPVVPSAEHIHDLIAAHGEEVRDPDVADLQAMVERFAASPLRERIAQARRVRTEVAFGFPLEPDGAGGRSLLINGIVDVHAAEEDRVLIVDYKSDHLGGQDPAGVTSEHYETQRIVYALAGLRSGAARVEVAYCFLERPEETVKSVFEAADAMDLEGRLLELAAGVVGARFAPSERPHRGLCAGCPGQPALCRWGPDRTLAALPA